ncbi:MAG: hypothetical protein V4654_02760 [Bdellovibrionota bacterium]
MKNQIKLGAFILLNLVFTQYSHANNRCMPAALDFVMQDFDQSLQTTGLIVQDRDNGSIKNLGKNISQESVTIADIHKNSYQIDIPLSFINHYSTNLVIRTYVMIESYSNCRITTEKPVYDSYEQFN